MKPELLHIISKFTSPEMWMELMKGQLPLIIDDNKLSMDDERFGKGYAAMEVLQDGLYFLIINALLRQDVVYQRDKDVTENYYLVVFSFCGGPVLHYRTDREYQLELTNGFRAVIVPPTVFSYVRAAKSDQIKLLTLVVEREWILENIIGADDSSYLSALMGSGHPVPLVEYLDYDHSNLITDLFFENYKDKIQKLSAVIRVLSFLIDVLNKERREEEQSITSNDRRAILEACKIIESDFKTFPSVKTLSANVKMGETSFKTKFKNIIGMSPYQFFLKLKLERARDLLEHSNHSVSEIGYQCGYTNLSHFARQFKKHFGILPSELVRERKTQFKKKR